MNVRGLLLAGLVLGSMIANAQGGTTSTRSSDIESRGYAAKGVRLSVFMPVLEAELEIEGFGRKASSDDEKLDRSVGVSGGYAYYPVGRVGFDGNLAFIAIEEKDEDDGDKSGITLARIDGNVGYAPNEIFYFKGGLNVSGWMQSDINDELKPSVGIQTYIGLQATQNIGAEIGYVMMSQRGEMSGFDVTMYERGLEFRLNGTF